MENIGRVNGNGTTNSVSNYAYVDNNVQSGSYEYRLKQIDYNGNYEYFYLASTVLISIPERIELSQNYPNPFNPSTKINYKLQASGFITLKVFDITGKQVAELVKSRQDAGTYEVVFDASQFGITAGVYLYRLEAGDFSITKKMVVLE
ncbi:MAG: T9SS type A sorting domain-containing protein [Ignavibacteria bacterium]|nr:T9SS type A sorting domain-containing protein [Ignavibacteria bacterium]